MSICSKIQGALIKEERNCATRKRKRHLKCKEKQGTTIKEKNQFDKIQGASIKE